jgi:hypothetical protein
MALWLAASYGTVLAANSGLDTPTGVADLPFGIEGTEIMDLTSSGLTITTTATSQALNVTAGTGAARVAYFQAAATDYVVAVTMLNNSVTCANGGQWGFGVNGSAPTTFSTMPAGSFWIHQDCGAARLTIAPNGYVGIGSMNPDGNLDVENGSNTAKLCLNGQCTTSLASSPVVFGGMWGNQSGFSCQYPNPITGGCSCPSYAPHSAHIMSANMGSGNQNGSVYFCYGP